MHRASDALSRPSGQHGKRCEKCRCETENERFCATRNAPVFESTAKSASCASLEAHVSWPASLHLSASMLLRS